MKPQDHTHGEQLATTATTFYSLPVCGSDLFSVAPGVPAEIALEHAASVLDAAIDTFSEALCNMPACDESAKLWSAFYNLPAVLGLVQSVLPLSSCATAPADGFGYYIAPADHKAPGPFTWFVVNHANECVVEYGTADTWSDADQIACNTIERLEQEPAPEPAKADPETLRRVWIDMAKMAADELAKLDRAGETGEGEQ
ncbi:hypothetical protein [Allochromatium vinosum]|uniref:Uncharacterized protein n=1 Tax=Allochromatium vinosum (strain ATCC 17899 / DSM 180 / NBRC 103801 / NCIMB 10441 / D) TaxID=572477 RepID=D3RR12_ALLVD|nr:hypothetical protein [Allochromatium vinosum]ADC61840.1 hypothetical protein Alvin_0894 [Allochromatium vinosum DSM 180]